MEFFHAQMTTNFVPNNAHCMAQKAAKYCWLLVPLYFTHLETAQTVLQ
jgi:hypothetical protein